VRPLTRAGFTRSAWLLLGLAASLAAQEPAPPADTVGPPRPTRLFRDDRPIEIMLTADFGRIFRDRDTTEGPRFPGRLVYRAPEGEEGEIPVELGTRGHSRLRRDVCHFPPLRVFLPTREQRPPFWRGQNSLRLSVNCRPGNRDFDQYVLEEYLLYRVYTLFTELSFRVRLTRATYLQEANADTAASTWAFFVEDPDDVARRNGGEIFEQPGVRFRDVDSTTMALLSVYEYLIGNTDWALQMLHNIRVVKVEPGFYYPVPFDFDFAGLIKTPYAGPSPQLPIRSVRERLYRGPCLEMSFLQTIFDRFVEKREAVYQLFRTQEGLEPRRVESHLKYLDDFYATISNPGKARREFRYVCG
jgi:hypothetical protein